ncbi:MAG: hypothetical protein LBE83_01495 [Propionibacteriaceae bacterium]|jgi:DNA-binding protein YbaB|nr:hypothetical protein [Propionibacteriaceae bacterium]
MLEQELEGSGQSVASLLDPPVTITCGFDGIVRSVSIDPVKRKGMTAGELTAAIQAAVTRVRFYVPDLSTIDVDMDQHEIESVKHTKSFTDWMSDITSGIAQPEVTGTDEQGIVTVVYSGRVLDQVLVRARSIAAATNDEIEHSIVVASQKAMTTLRALHERDIQHG